MLSAAESQMERAELDAVLQSGIFHRAPNLSSFLKYVCERYFEGEAGQIKEYSIAVEALNRQAGFDQKKDSIVRVEAHRLRKRLAEYYAGPGAGHPVKICIANGQYAPQFVRAESSPAKPLQEPTSPAPVPRTLSAVAVARSPQRSSWKALVAFATIAVTAAVFLPQIVSLLARARRPGSSPNAQAAPQAGSGNATVPVNSEFRMLAGYSGAAYTDRQGHRWEPDAYFTGGKSVLLSPGKVIEGLPDPDLLHGSREGDFRYDIPLRSGIYELHLYFSETVFARGNPSEGEEVRSFRVDINGRTQLDLFDALSEAGGPNRLQVRTFKDITPGKDGFLRLQFLHQSGQPFVNALEILPSLPGKIRPIRIVARKTPVTDTEGRVWSGDEFVMGGHLTSRRDSVSNSRDTDLFEGERFGSFAYHLPVAPGKYRITLHFAETYFGSNVAGAPPFAKASRLFDVRANGRILLKDFDLGEEAGGPNRGIKRTFENIEPNAQGLIVLEFHPTRNYACVNAIEVEETE